MKEKRFSLKNSQGQKDTPEKFSGAVYADDLELLAHRYSQNECLLPSVRIAKRGIDLYVNFNESINKMSLSPH